LADQYARRSRRTCPYRDKRYTVLALDGGDAIEALKDQLLVRPPGGKKKGTKTGAADSAWLRTVFREADEDFSTVLIVTGDRGAVDGAVEEWGTDAPIVAAHFDEARELLALTEPATPDQAWHIIDLLAEQLPLMPIDPHETGPLPVLELFDAGDLSRLAAGQIGPPLYDHVQGASLSNIDELVGLEQVRLRRADNTYTAEMYALA
jgi:hypothetical protein